MPGNNGKYFGEQIVKKIIFITMLLIMINIASALDLYSGTELKPSLSNTTYIINTTQTGINLVLVNETCIIIDNLTRCDLNNNTQQLFITKINPPLVLTILPSINIYNGTQTTVTGTGCPGEISCNLYRNNTLVTNPDVQNLSIGSYSYTFNTTGNTNYNAYSITSILTVFANIPANITGYLIVGYNNVKRPKVLINSRNCDELTCYSKT